MKKNLRRWFFSSWLSPSCFFRLQLQPLPDPKGEAAATVIHRDMLEAQGQAMGANTVILPDHKAAPAKAIVGIRQDLQEDRGRGTIMGIHRDRQEVKEQDRLGLTILITGTIHQEQLVDKEQIGAILPDPPEVKGQVLPGRTIPITRIIPRAQSVGKERIGEIHRERREDRAQDLDSIVEIHRVREEEKERVLFGRIIRDELIIHRDRVEDKARIGKIPRVKPEEREQDLVFNKEIRRVREEAASSSPLEWALRGAAALFVGGALVAVIGSGALDSFLSPVGHMVDVAAQSAWGWVR